MSGDGVKEQEPWRAIGRLVLQVTSTGLALFARMVSEEGRTPDTAPPPDGPPEPPRDAPEAEASPSEGAAARPSDAPPSDVPAPAVEDVATLERLPASRRRAWTASATHSGPPAAAEDKGNQDFAFDTALVAGDGGVWHLAGVADGVTQSPWSERCARHAAGAFVEALADQLDASSDFESAEVRAAFSRSFVGRLLGRIGPDRDALRTEKRTPFGWGAQGFRRHVLDGPIEKTNNWHQSTLLAAAVGPGGGFALLVGDGYATIRRRRGAGRAVALRHLNAASRAGRPDHVLRLAITAAEIEECIVPISSEDAEAIEIVLATDGVSDASDDLEHALEGVRRVAVDGASHPLDTVWFRDGVECWSVLTRLSSTPSALAVNDNMSLAFLSRPVFARKP